MAPGGHMQMLVTRFERLSRRISLSGLMSRHQAEQAISAGRVKVDGRVATANFKVFAEAPVTVDGVTVAAPPLFPRLWALDKPRDVLCQTALQTGSATLRDIMKQWHDREQLWLQKQGSTGLEEARIDDKHFVIVNGLAYGSDGIVLLTNDGIFAETLMRADSSILSVYDVKISGDPPVDVLHAWRHRARAGGVNYGQVFCSLTKRTQASSRLRIRYVETPERPLEMLLESARMRINRLRRYAFGPYIVTDLGPGRVREVEVHESLRMLVPPPDVRQTLVPAKGKMMSADGKIRIPGLHESHISSAENAQGEAPETDGDHSTHMTESSAIPTDAQL